jgi:hypothetical protein
MFDPAAGVFYIPSWWRWNPPANANVLKGNLKDLNEIPPCALLDAFTRNLETLPETFHQTFLNGLRQHLGRGPPIQEEPGKQEQGQRASRGGEGEKHTQRVVPPSGDALLKIARTAVLFTNPNDSPESLLDKFSAIATHENVRGFTKVAATNAIVAAQLERRMKSADDPTLKRSPSLGDSRYTTD